MCGMERQDVNQDDALVAKVQNVGWGAFVLARANRLVVHGS